MGLKIFVSSRFYEFEALRAKIAQEQFSKLDVGLEVELLDHRGGIADDRPPSLMSIEKASEADIFILLLGESYQEEPYSGKESYTHQEYNAAKEKNLPILAFPIGDSYCEPRRLSDYPLFRQLQESVLQNQEYHTSAPAIASNCSIDEIYEKIYSSLRDFVIRFLKTNLKFNSIWNIDIQTQRKLEQQALFGQSKRREDIYIERQIDTLVAESITQKRGGVLFISGEGGVGKTTLLQKFALTKDTPTLLIDIKDSVDMSMVDILIDENITHIENAPLVVAMLDEIYTHKEEGEKIAFGTEFRVLEALQKDFANGGLILIDTFEKNKNSNIISRVSFESKLKSTRSDIHYRWRDYVEGLVYHFADHISFVIAGRNTIAEVSQDMGKTKFLDMDGVVEVSLGGFGVDEIEVYCRAYDERYHIGIPTAEQLTHIYSLTQGNTLLVTLFPKIIDGYDEGWNALDYQEMKRLVEEDREFGLLYYFTTRIVSHLGEQAQELWRLVVPRVILESMEGLLFDDIALLDTIIGAGLATKKQMKGGKRYYLLDNVHDAIVAHSKKQPKYRELSSWHDHPSVKELHLKFIEYFGRQEDLYQINSEFELYYHTIMTKEGFEREYGVERDHYSELLFASMSLSNQKKIAIFKNYDTLAKHQIEGLVRILTEEQSKWLQLLSPNLYNELKRLASIGELALVSSVDLQGNKKTIEKDTIRWIEDVEFLLKLQEKQQLKDDDSLWFILGSAYGNKKEYDNAIESYQKALEINPKNDAAYYNMGIAYDHLGEFEQVIDCYIQALHINPHDSSPYTNLFELQLTQGQPFDAELEAKYIELFSHQKEKFIKYEMLKILQDIVANKSVDIDAWVMKYEGVALGWGFDELDAWVGGMDDGDLKRRVVEALGVFRHF